MHTASAATITVLCFMLLLVNNTSEVAIVIVM